MRSVVEIGATVPAFLGKLWKLVNDSETNNLISWSPGGKTFVIKNQADFARELLPLYYKHNNMASFIRQLNMYGFHKITSVENGGLRYEKDEIEFSHPCFMRGHAYLLEHIKRKIANPKSIVTSNESGEKILLKPELMNKVLADVKQMKGKQESLDAKFSAMKQENEALWREVAILRQKHIKQQQIVNNLIQFLMSLVQPARPPNPNVNNVGVKRPYQLMINNAAHNAGDQYPGRLKNVKLDKDLLEELNEDNLEDGPTIHELAHDDLMHNEVSQDSVNAATFMNNISPGSNSGAGHSPVDPSSSLQYHVTMEDGDDAEADGTRQKYPVYSANNNGLLRTIEVEVPMVASPSPNIAMPTSPIDQPVITNVVSMSPGPSRSKARNNVNKVPQGVRNLLSPSNFTPSADLRLPAEIFASDDSVSDAGVAASDDTLLQDVLGSEALLAATKDKMLGGINIKLEKPNPSNKSKKSKKTQKDNTTNLNLEDIKTELQDDLDWNNMTLATVNNNPGVNRYPSVGDIDDHLDSMQTDLDSLREMLRSDAYALDTNTLMGTDEPAIGLSMMSHIPSRQHPSHDYLFGSEDPFYGLSYNPVDEKTAKTANNAKKQKGEIANISGGESRVQDVYSNDDAEGNQLISYTGNIPDFDDISMPELEAEGADTCPSPLPGGSELNTPLVETRSPSYMLRP
ncbi:heat shock factor protein isoform X2 [Pectinophora gossypiella]|uniref:heat shock factor protein isoform X2 n=1 Tax=Pectinophora gossypiella TaxID=13191 RepID=UPI00214E0BA2|nr:heat shock factor protein isoform X2 [Pectinophora gossypiella]